MKFALFEFHFLELASPSLGREWIEIRLMIKALFYRRVSLLGEGVD